MYIVIDIIDGHEEPYYRFSDALEAAPENSVIWSEKDRVILGSSGEFYAHPYDIDPSSCWYDHRISWALKKCGIIR